MKGVATLKVKKKYLIAGVGVITLAIIVISIVQVQTVRSQPSAATATASPTPSGLATFDPYGTFQVAPTLSIQKKTDLAPNAALADKATIIVQHRDGSFEEFLLLPSMAEAFEKQLPAGDRIVRVDAPQSLMGPPPQLTPPPAGSQLYSVTPGPAVGTPPPSP